MGRKGQAYSHPVEMPQTSIYGKLWLVISGRFWRIAALVSLLLILYTTLFPFDFFSPPIRIADLPSQFDHTFRASFVLQDAPLNILLFIPFGCSAAGLIRKKTIPFWMGGFIVAGSGILLSLLVETLQVFLPVRFSTLADIFTNSLGAILGFLLFAFAGDTIEFTVQRVLTYLRLFFTGWKLALAYALFLILALLPGVLLRNAGSLNSWDDQYPLLLGNELEAGRPWVGQLSSVWVADRHLSLSDASALLQNQPVERILPQALVADYRLENANDLKDHSGNLPDLTWYGAPAVETGASIRTTNESWLLTSGPVQPLVHQIRQSGQFALGFVAATDGNLQEGPARILSISSGIWHRNLTVGQEDEALVIRLRTAFSGGNGQNPELRFPQVFTDKEPHQILVSFDGRVLDVYVDQPSRRLSFEMTPAVLLFWFARPVPIPEIGMNSWSTILFQGLYLVLVFVPIGWLLAGLFSSSSSGRLRAIALSGIGIVAAAVLVPWLLQNPNSIREFPVWQSLVALGIAYASLYLSKPDDQLPANLRLGY